MYNCSCYASIFWMMMEMVPGLLSRVKFTSFILTHHGHWRSFFIGVLHLETYVMCFDMTYLVSSGTLNLMWCQLRTLIILEQVEGYTACKKHVPCLCHYSFIDPKRMKGWVGLVGWPVADSLPIIVVTHQLQVWDRESLPARDDLIDELPVEKRHLSKLIIICWI